MKLVGISLTLAACLLVAQPAVAGDGCGAPECCGAQDCCAHCGCKNACAPKTCQLICGVEKVKKHCWVVECEEFCPLLPGCIGNRCCDSCCGEACGGECGACEAGCQAGCEAKACGQECKTPKLATPKCGKTRVKKVLIKKEYECEVPVYKCVVRYLCGECCGNPAATGPAPVPGPAPAPNPPAPPPPAPLPGQQAYDFAPLPPL